MSAQGIIAELPRLKPEELRQVKASLMELEKRPGPPDRSVWEVLLKSAGKAEGLPPDLSANHDHYLHGTPKRMLSLGKTFLQPPNVGSTD